MVLADFFHDIFVRTQIYHINKQLSLSNKWFKQFLIISVKKKNVCGFWVTIVVENYWKMEKKFFLEDFSIIFIKCIIKRVRRERSFLYSR